MMGNFSLNLGSFGSDFRKFWLELNFMINKFMNMENFEGFPNIRTTHRATLVLGQSSVSSQTRLVVR